MNTRTGQTGLDGVDNNAHRRTDHKGPRILNMIWISDGDYWCLEAPLTEPLGPEDTG